MRYLTGGSHFVATLAFTLWLLGCPATPDGTPDATPTPTATEAAPLGMNRAQLFQYITTGNPDSTQPVGQLPPQPFYESWPLFPGPASNPKEFLNKRLGLAIHGRWVTVYVNPIAAQHIESYLNEVNTVPVGTVPVVPPTEFPPGSVIVKVNFANDPQATVIQQASNPGVLTVAYKPERGFCQSAVQYNTVDCLGGDWLWAFYGLGKAKALDSFIAESSGTFCINCHTPAFKADYLRGLLRRARTIAFDRVPAAEPTQPPSVPATDPFCQQPIVLSAQLPTDVALDPAKITDPAQRQRLFDCFAWRTFVSLNWPASDQRGVAEASAPFGKASGNRTWESYAQTYEVFQPQDADWVPSEQIWQSPRRLPSACSSAAPDEPVISMNSKSQSSFADLVNETGQAFAGTFGTLTDRNGNLVHYQVLFNQAEFDYLLADGKAATANLTPIGPASGPESFLPDGSIEVKSAWKQLCLDTGCEQQDVESDFYARKVWIYDAAGPTCTPMTVGLIGLHINAKTFWAPQRVAATFEHKNNAPLATLIADGSPPVVPRGEFLFYDGSCPPQPDTCFKQPFLEGRPAGADPCCPNLEINRIPGKLGFDSRYNNQLIRLDKPGGSGLNQRFRLAMGEAGSPLANLILVNTQWPMNGRRPAAGKTLDSRPFNTRNCDDNELSPDGSCYTRIPRFLRNTVIESYMTTWIENGDGHPQQISNRSCTSCHASGTDFSFIFEDAVELTVELN